MTIQQQHHMNRDNQSALSCAAVITPQISPVFEIKNPSGKRLSPVVVNSPHSGRQYLNRFLDQSRLSLKELRQVEDAGIDIMLDFQPLPAPVLMAQFPRSFVDVNRSADEIDPHMFDGDIDTIAPDKSRYLRSGLGMIPKKAARQQEIYNALLPAEELEYRKQQFYLPYHNQLSALLDNARTDGDALLLDCHSMPSGLFGVDADIIIGSDHGQSAAPWMVNAALDYFSREGLTTRLNAPFSGGFITKNYGCPEQGISALQIEICRSCYLNERTLELKPDWSRLASILCRFVLHMDEMMVRMKNR